MTMKTDKIQEKFKRIHDKAISRMRLNISKNIHPHYDYEAEMNKIHLLIVLNTSPLCV